MRTHACKQPALTKTSEVNVPIERTKPCKRVQNFLLYKFKKQMYLFCPYAKDPKVAKSMMSFLNEHTHLQKYRLCLCEKSCNYSTLQLFSLQVTQQNVLQDIWGKHVWRLIHTVARHHHTKLKEIFSSLQFLLPCSECRVNFTKELKIRDFQCTQKDAEKAAFELHNRVNERLGKREWSWDEYENKRNEEYCKHIDVEEVLVYLEMQVKNASDIVKVQPVIEKERNGSAFSRIYWLKLRLCRAHLVDVMNELHAQAKPDKQKFGNLQLRSIL